MSYNILIVDDSATTRAVIKRIIKLTDVPTGQIHEAGDGRSALEVLRTAKVDLVLADLTMPGMGGLEMTHEMRQSERTRHVPVIVISAEPNLDRLEELQAEGVQACIRKPFTPEALRDALAQTLGACHA